jgi:hypothetical protein
VPSLLPRSKKVRTALIVIASIAVIAVVATLLANTADSGKKKVAGTKKPSASSTTTTALKLAVGTVKVQNTGPNTKLPAPVRRALMGAAQTYVNDAILAPLTSGHVDNGYEKIFGLSLRAAASGPDRGALTEAATGVARGAVQTTASRVRIDGLGDPNGKVALVATTFTMTLKATTPAGAVTIHRNTALTFENQFGSWVVTAYDVGVLRSVGATTSAAHASTTDGTSRHGAAT